MAIDSHATTRTVSDSWTVVQISVDDPDERVWKLVHKRAGTVLQA